MDNETRKVAHGENMGRKAHHRDPGHAAKSGGSPRIPEGFPGQIWRVIPTTVMLEATKNNLFNPVYPIVMGWFPEARYHYFERPKGCAQHVFIFCMAGEGWFEVAGRREVLKAQEAVFLPKGLPHAYGAMEDQPWSIHWAHFDGRDAAQYISYLPARMYKLPVSPDVAQEVSRCFFDCYEQLKQNVSMPSLIHAAHLLRLIFSQVFFAKSHYAETISARHPWLLHETIEFMQAHLRGGLTLASLARRAGLSKSQFSALFKSQIGFSPMDYFAHLRIQEACYLLDNTRLSVKDICTKIGFEDQYYFSRVFRKTMGMPPVAYRKIIKF